MATIELIKGVYQDGGNFYMDPEPLPQDDFEGDTTNGGLLASYDCVANDHDMEGAQEARRLFARDFPEYSYTNREAGK